MVPIVIGKCGYSYFLEFGYLFLIMGAKPHSSAALVNIQYIFVAVYNQFSVSLSNNPTTDQDRHLFGNYGRKTVDGGRHRNCKKYS